MTISMSTIYNTICMFIPKICAKERKFKLNYVFVLQYIRTF